MKRRVLFVLLCIVFSVGLMACSSSTTSKDETDNNDKEENVGISENTSTDSPNSKEEPKEEPKEPETFIGTEDLLVDIAYVYDGDVYVVVNNKSDKAILDFEVAYTAFDQNGFSSTTDRDGYESGKASAANILPESKYVAGWYGAGSASRYAVATVTKITYADGTEWSADCIDVWADDAKKSFSVDAYNSKINALSEDAKKAETIEYAKLSNEKMNHTNQFSTSADYEFKVTNTGSKGIAKISIFVLEFDENGYAVDVSPYDTYCKNGRVTGGTVNVAAGKSDEFSSSLFFEGETDNFKSIICEIEFQDRTTWTNPYLQAWILYNNR